MVSTRLHPVVYLGPLLAMMFGGCGTTRWTDTKRTATEQMLVSDAIDRSVSRIDFHLLTGKEVFLDTTYLGETVDKDYLTSTLRQEMVSAGCILKEKREQATFIVEVRAGSVGTDRHDLLYGVPAINLPTFSASATVPNALPEVALARRTDQQAVAKIAVFAYHRETGAPVWQSGADVVASKARDLWVFGAGPFQKGTIYDHTQFAGNEFHVPLVEGEPTTDGVPAPVRVSQERLFNTPDKFPAKLAATPPKVDAKSHLLDQPFGQESRPQSASFEQPLGTNPVWDPLRLPPVTPATNSK